MIKQPILPKTIEPKSLKTIRAIGLVFIFTVGIFSIIASITASNKTTVVQTHKKVQRADVLEELQEKQIILALAVFSRKGTKYEVLRLEGEIAKLKAELAAIDAETAKAISSDPKTCFSGDMLVLTEEGAKSIADIRVGDRVLSMNASGEQVPAEVLKTYADQNYHYFFINNKIKVTALHRFYTSNGWKKAHELEIGDLIQLNSGDFEKILSLEFFKENLDVYNLTISKNHNFYISPDGKSGYLVHNTPGGDGGGGPSK